MYTGTRPGVSPVIRAGKGWRGRRELAPRCSATQLSACLCGHIDRDMIVIPSSEPPPPPSPPPPPQGTDRFVTFCFLRCDLMADSSGQPSGAARRRRERRLRSMLRHEQQTVRMALAAALHHSAGPKEKVEMQQNGALRGQKTAARAGEEVVHDAHDALRGQKTPPPGVRPGSLAEPGPQRSDRSLRRSSGQTPLLGVPSLADAPAEAIDGRTLRYLLKANLARKKNEEEEEERKYKERAAESSRRAQALLDHVASLPKRKRKKRKKKKLPRTPRPRQGRRRPCDHQRHVLAVRGASVPVHPQSGGHSCFMSGFGRSSLEREVQLDFRVHSSSCGAYHDVVHSPLEWLFHRCHCYCRDLVLLRPLVLRECLRRDVVLWWIFHS